MSQIVGKAGSLRKGERTWDNMVKRKDSKGTKSPMVDFTVYIHIMFMMCPLSCVQKGFYCMHCHQNSEKPCNLPRTSNQHSCYLRLSTADVTEQPPPACPEDRDSGEAAGAALAAPLSATKLELDVPVPLSALPFPQHLYTVTRCQGSGIVNR